MRPESTIPGGARALLDLLDDAEESERAILAQEIVDAGGDAVAEMITRGHAHLIGDDRLDRAQEAIISASHAEAIYVFACDAPRADIPRLSVEIVRCFHDIPDVGENYLPMDAPGRFARDIPGADVSAMQREILALEDRVILASHYGARTFHIDPVVMIDFLALAPGVDARLLQREIASRARSEDIEHLIEVYPELDSSLCWKTLCETNYRHVRAAFLRKALGVSLLRRPRMHVQEITARKARGLHFERQARRDTEYRRAMEVVKSNIQGMNRQCARIREESSRNSPSMREVIADNIAWIKSKPLHIKTTVRRTPSISSETMESYDEMRTVFRRGGQSDRASIMSLVASSGDPALVYLFARDEPGADIAACVRAVIDSGEMYWIRKMIAEDACSAPGRDDREASEAESELDGALRSPGSSSGEIVRAFPPVALAERIGRYLEVIVTIDQ